MPGALGVIAGTGFSTLDLLEDPRPQVVDTPYGTATVVTGRLHDRATVFCPRHGPGHAVPPHRVNYRATIDALARLGVVDVLAINVVGGIGHDAGDLVVVDDYLDFTSGRASTYFDGTTPEGVVHLDSTDPYDARLRGAWLEAARRLDVPVTPAGIYACFNGPRFETRAEIRMARAAGATVVGMTGVPEVVLARERSLPYAALCLVVNPAAGESDRPITMDEIDAAIGSGARVVTGLLDEAARLLAEER